MALHEDEVDGNVECELRKESSEGIVLLGESVRVRSIESIHLVME
jgi:hypothetical protein